MFNNLKNALMDPEFHKRMLQQVALAAVVAVVTVAAKQVATVVAEEVQSKIAELKEHEPLEVAAE